MIIVPELTDFQTKAEGAVNALLHEKQLQIAQREVLVGTVPFLSPNAQAALHISAGDVELWLYEDEATLSVHGSDDRFERVAFDSTDALLVALIACLRHHLRADLDRPGP